MSKVSKPCRVFLGQGDSAACRGPLRCFDFIWKSMRKFQVRSDLKNIKLRHLRLCFVFQHLKTCEDGFLWQQTRRTSFVHSALRPLCAGAFSPRWTRRREQLVFFPLFVVFPCFSKSQYRFALAFVLVVFHRWLGGPTFLGFPSIGRSWCHQEAIPARTRW